MNFQIIKAAHAEILVTDLNEAYKFYVETLGFYPTYLEENRIYLRGYEERYHHSLILTKSEKPGIKHLAYKLAILMT